MSRRGRPPHPDILTPREWEVLSLIREGASNDEIAQKLGITERTAKYHVSEILSKLGVSSREEAVAAIGQRVEAATEGRWGLALGVALALSSAAVLGGLAVLIWAVLNGGRDGNGVPAELSADDAYSGALAAATRPDSLLHITYEQVSPGEGGGERQMRVGEMWVDAAEDSVRLESHNGRDWTSEDSGGDSLSIYANGYSYYADGTQAYRSDFRYCSGTDSTVIAVMFFCGGEPSDSAPYTRSGGAVNTAAEFEGRPAISVVMLELQPPSPPPTPDVGAFRYTAYFDRSTFLPLGQTIEYSGYPTVPSTTRFQAEFIDKSSVPADYLDPRSIGYGVANAEGRLREVAEAVRVFWLGEDILIEGYSEYVLTGVDGAPISDPRGLTQQSASLRYEAPDGWPEATIYLWTRSAWDKFFADATSQLLSRPECVTESKVDGGGYTARVFKMPPISFPVPSNDACGLALRDSVIGPQNYFAFVDLGDVVVDLRPWWNSELDNPAGIRAMLEALQEWSG